MKLLKPIWKAICRGFWTWDSFATPSSTGSHGSDFTVANGFDPLQLVGRTLHDRFELIKALGHGGCGAVYEAVDFGRSRRRRVAVKVKSDQFPTWKFLHEANMAFGLEHPKIVPIYEVIEDQQTPVILLRYVEGVSLDKLISQGAIGLTAMLGHVLTLVSDRGALRYVHDHQKIHRDIKPANLLSDKDDSLWLMDFGLAKEIGQHAISVDGRPIGTIAYMAPEQARGKHDQVGPHSDIYSLGAMLYESACGRLPFEGTAYDALTRIISAEEARPVSQLVPGINPAAERVIMRCIRKRIADRYQSCHALWADLGPLVSGPPSHYII